MKKKKKKKKKKKTLKIENGWEMLKKWENNNKKTNKVLSPKMPPMTAPIV